MKTMKKVVATVLSMAMLVTGLYLVPAEADEVQAAESTAYVTDTYGNLNTTSPTKEGYLFAGWFDSDKCTLDNAITDTSNLTETSVAKFVKKDTLSVKLQIANTAVTEVTDKGTMNAASAIRFISSVDSLNYKAIGFNVTYTKTGEKVGSFSDNQVYERIDSKMKNASTGEVKEYEYSPKIVSTKSEYFFTAKLAVSDQATDYTVQAYWETLDGTVVYGESRVVCVNDNSSSIINLTVDDALTVGTYTDAISITSTKNTASSITVEVPKENITVLNSQDGYSNVRIVLPEGTTVDQFASATKITLGSASGIFRNHTTEYTGTNTQDTSWYDVSVADNETEFIIATNADLYGMQAKGIEFSGKTIYLISDIRINAGKPVLGTDNTTVTWYAYNTDGTVSDTTVNASYNWTPISNDSSWAFAGTFDGQMHTISGLNANHSAWNYQGLFGYTASGSTIQKLKLTDSYINANRFKGSLVGQANGGTIKTVYSDAVVSGNYNGNSWGNGGIVGGIGGTVTMENCWFAGDVTASGNSVSGIVGSMQSGTLTMTNCLNSGNVTSTNTNPKIGGLVGDVGANTVTINCCLNTGTITASADDAISGAVAGTITTGTLYCNYSHGYFADQTVASINSGGKFYVTSMYKGVVTENADKSSAYSNVPIISLWKNNANQFIGENAATHMECLDFENVWSVVTDSTPILSAFN